MKTIITLITILTTLHVSADQYTDYAALAAELGQNMNVKYMEKDWKKAADTWVQEASAAADLTVLREKMVAFEQSLSDKAISTAWESERTDWEKQCKEAKDYVTLTSLLTELEAGILDEAFEEEWAGRVDAWAGELDEIALSIQKTSEEITVDKADFTTLFNSIWEASYNSFSEIINSEESFQLMSEGAHYTHYSTSVMLPEAYSIYITEDDEGLFEYVCYYNCGHFKDNATVLLDQLVGFVDGLKPEGFVKLDNVNIQYEDRKSYTFEFEGEKFADTGKKPTSTLGIVKEDDLYLAVVRITEPVFKR